LKLTLLLFLLSFLTQLAIAELLLASGNLLLQLALGISATLLKLVAASLV
jgi:hypothetical protein